MRRCREERDRAAAAAGGSLLLECGECVAADVCHPNVGPVKGHGSRVGADGEGA